MQKRNMSLKSRLRISILVLVVTIVVVLSALHVRTSLDETLTDVHERAILLVQQVKTYVLERVNEHGPVSGDFTRNKLAWYTSVQRDPVLARVLEKSMSNASYVVEIAVLDENNRVLLSSLPRRTGLQLPLSDSFPNLETMTLWTKLRQVLNSTHDYAIDVPLGIPDQPKPIMTVRALLSPVLIRNEIVPQLKGLAAVSLASILISAILSILVSNLVSSSFLRVGRNIERITAGQPADTAEFDTEELMGVQSKLVELSHVYQGARDDAETLRRNIDQLLQRLEEAVFVFDEAGILRMAGKPAERLLVKNHNDLVGKPIDDIFPSYTQLGAAIQSALRLRLPIRDHAVTFDRPNLPQSRLLASVEMVGGEGSQFAGTIVTVKDAESRRQLQSQLDIANRVASIGRLSSGVAHEIKNPLNAIALHLEVLRSRIANEGAEQDLATITREIQRLDRVVKTFIDFNRPLEPQMRECNLVALSRDAVSVAERRAATHIRLSLTADFEQAPVFADAELSRQALLNVLVNAIESMDKPGEIRLQLRELSDAYVVDVTDQGRGIAPEIQDKIYNLYFSTKPNAGGIGLAIAFLVMQLHNGFIEFESEVGRGTTFRLHFPAFRHSEAVH